VAQVVKYLPNNGEGLSSNPNNDKKKKKKKKKNFLKTLLHCLLSLLVLVRSVIPSFLFFGDRGLAILAQASLDLN
jgi:flagellar basal body-associated protein FliL